MTQQFFYLKVLFQIRTNSEAVLNFWTASCWCIYFFSEYLAYSSLEYSLVNMPLVLDKLWISSVTNTITVHIMISSNFSSIFQSLKVQHLPSIKLSGIIPLQFIDNPVVHPHIKICNTKTGVCSLSARSKAIAENSKHSLGLLEEALHV